MEQKKHIFFDLDGTLLNKDHQILNETIDEINRLKNMGIGISIATGRSVNMAIDYVNQLNIKDPVVLSNGTFILNPTTKTLKVLTDGIHIEVKKYFLNYLRTYGGTITWFTEKQDYVYSTSYSGAKVLPYTTNLVDMSGMALIDFENYLLNTKVYQLTLVYEGIDCVANRSIDLVTDEFKELERKGFAKITNTTQIFIDANSNNIDKINAIKEVIKELNLDINNVYAFGDSNNDYNMIKTIPNSIAMGNASESVKSVAKRIIGDNNHPSIAECLKELF